MNTFVLTIAGAFALASVARTAELDRGTNSAAVTVFDAPDAVATAIMEKPIYRVGIHVVSFSPDGQKIATGDGNGKLRLWNAQTGELLREITAHSNWVFAVHWARDSSQIVTGGGDNLIHWFDVREPSQPIRTVAAHSNDVHAVALRRDGKMLYSAGDDRQIVFWETKRNVLKKRFTAHKRQIPALILSPNEKLLASGSRDHTIRIWDSANGKLKDTLIGHTGDVISLSFSPGGELLASAGWDHTVRLWEVKRGKALRILASDSKRVSSVAFSPSGKHLISSSGSSLRMFETASGKERWSAQFNNTIRSAEGNETPEDLSAAAFSPDGRTIAAGSTTGAVYLVAADSGKVERTIGAEISERRTK